MKPIKNVILYSNKLPPKHIGGIETNAYYLAKKLKESSKYNVCVFTQGKKRFYRKYQQIDSSNLDLRAHLIDKKKVQNFGDLEASLTVSGFNPDETLIYHNTLDLHSHFKALGYLGYRQVARSGGNDIFYHQKKNAALRKQFLTHLNFLDKFILNSNYSLKRSIELGLEAKKLVVIKGGCERGSGTKVPSAYSNDDLPRIITCGRLVDFKALEDAIDALNIVKKQGLDFKFYMIGDGPLVEDLAERIKKFNMENCCIFLGKQPPQEIPSFYLNSDIYLSTSKDIVKDGDGYKYVHTETMGRSICEAQVHGLPVISTDAGGAPEMLKNQETGLIVPQGNVQAIAGAICCLLKDPLFLQQLSAEAETFAQEEFGWEKVFADTFNVFSSLEG